MPVASTRLQKVKKVIAGLAIAAAFLATSAAPAEGVPTPPAPVVTTAAETGIGFELPAPSGPFRVGTTELHLIDRTRPDPWVSGDRRELMVSVFYPARRTTSYPSAPWMLPVAATHFDQQLSPALGIDTGTVDWAGVRTSSHKLAPPASRPGGYPVVLYSPGQGVPRTLGTALVEDLASRGYVVVSIDHTHDASEVAFPGGRLELDRIPELTPDVVEKLVHVRVADTRFVLDQLAILRQGGNPDAEHRQLPRGLGRALDLSRVGMFGHSAGGFTAAQTMDEDQRIDAGVNLDGTLDYDLAGKDLSPVARHGLDRPFLLMGAGAVTHHTMPSWTSFWEHSTGWKLDLNVPRGGHFTFTDYQTFLPQLDHALGLPPELLRQAIGTLDSQADRQGIVRSERAYLAAFFDQHLRGQPQPLLWWPTPEHPEVSFIR